MSHQTQSKAPSKRRRWLFISGSVSLLLVTLAAPSQARFAPVEGLWENTVQLVDNFLDTKWGRYINDIATKYLPQGIDVLIGDVGVPSLDELAQQIQVFSGENESGINTTIQGQIWNAHAEVGTARAIARQPFSMEAQTLAREFSETSVALGAQTAQLAMDCESLSITQEIMKCLTAQQGNTAELLNMNLLSNQQMVQQLAAGNLAHTVIADQATREARTQQAEAEMFQIQSFNRSIDANAVLRVQTE